MGANSGFTVLDVLLGWWRGVPVQGQCGQDLPGLGEVGQPQLCVREDEEHSCAGCRSLGLHSGLASSPTGL